MPRLPESFQSPMRLRAIFWVASGGAEGFGDVGGAGESVEGAGDQSMPKTPHRSQPGTTSGTGRRSVDQG